MTAELLAIAPGSRVLFIASTGGHLTQLVRIAKKIATPLSTTWVTFDSAQSRSLLADYPDVRFIPYVAPRDIKGAARAIRFLTRLGRTGNYDVALSTGAGVALSLPALRLTGLRCVYVESVSRVSGPSLTGRILARVPGLERRTQHVGWSNSRWPFEFTLLDDYEIGSSADATTVMDRPLSLFVTLGTIQPYRFDAMLNAVTRLLAPGDEVVWQVGCTNGVTLDGQVFEGMDREKLHAFATKADVVISHAGVGTALDLLDLGIRPVLLARRSSAGEHVDDHQQQIADVMSTRNLATVRTPEALTRADLLAAGSQSVGLRSLS